MRITISIIPMHFATLDVDDCRRICDYRALFNIKWYGVVKIRCVWGVGVEILRIQLNVPQKAM